MCQRAEQTTYAVRVDQLVRCRFLGYLCADVLDGHLDGLQIILNAETGEDAEKKFSFLALRSQRSLR